MKTLFSMFAINQAFAAVHAARVMAADHGLTAAESFRDREGRFIIDALPTHRDAYNASTAAFIRKAA